jgi:hypothetical protein
MAAEEEKKDSETAVTAFEDLTRTMCTARIDNGDSEAQKRWCGAPTADGTCYCAKHRPQCRVCGVPAVYEFLMLADDSPEFVCDSHRAAQGVMAIFPLLVAEREWEAASEDSYSRHFADDGRLSPDPWSD